MPSLHSNRKNKCTLLLAAVLINCALVINCIRHVQAFVQQPRQFRPVFGISKFHTRTQRSSAVSIANEKETRDITGDGSSTPLYHDESISASGEFENDEDVNYSAHEASPSTASTIRCPLKYLGPYPAISLRFPHLATSSQRARNVTGICLDFVIDTAANLNTLNGQVATELRLEQVGEALPGIGTSGLMAGGHTYELGDTELEGGHPIVATATVADGPDGEEGQTDGVQNNFLFMQNLTASVMPVASPVSAGLLSLAFLYCFEGGVEFRWGQLPSPQLVGVGQSENDNNVVMKDGLLATNDVESMPSVTFYGEKDDIMAKNALEGLKRIPIRPIPVTQLPSIVVRINGVEMPALLDTGSPITVLNQQAAKQAGIETIELPSQSQHQNAFNPLAAVANKFKEAQAISKAAANGDLLTIGGPNGPVNLLRSVRPVEISAVGDVGTDADEDGSETASAVSFGMNNRVFVGDIPGLQALNGIGVDAPPAVVLGMDVLRQRPIMLLRARDNEVYF